MQLLHGDSAAVLSKLRDESVHTVITSPPYYRTRKYGSIKEEIGREKNVEQYIESLRKVFSQCFRLLVKEGTCFVNIGDSYSNRRSNNVPEKFVFMMEGIGFKKISTIIWKKKNGNPTSVKIRPRDEFEYIYVFVKDLKNYYFQPLYEPVQDYDRMLSAIKNYKASDYKIKTAARQKYYDRQRELISMGLVPLKLKGNVWNIATTKEKGTKHIAIFPIEIPYNCLKMGCPPKICCQCHTPYIRNEEYEVLENDKAKFGGIKHQKGVGGVYSGKIWKQKFFSSIDYTRNCCNPCNPFSSTYSGTVLDPFVGSGTTCWVAQAMGYENSIGVDINGVIEGPIKNIKEKIDKLSYLELPVKSKIGPNIFKPHYLNSKLESFMDLSGVFHKNL